MPYSTAEILYAKHQRVLLSFSQCAQELNIAERTIYNLSSENKLPFPIAKIGSRRLVHVEDLASYIDGLLPQGNNKKRGRPSKKEQLHKLNLEKNGGTNA